MDYVVGSIAALLSGNVTPNRPKQLRNAQTPIKHQSSPNVTPKSEFLEDRSIFLSPTMQKKKAIVKKSPKRIFENPGLDVTNGEENDSSHISPKADKVKKHLKDELEADSLAPTVLLSPKSPKNNEVPPKKGNKKRLSDTIVNDENTPKKKQCKSEIGNSDSIIQNEKEELLNFEASVTSPKRKGKKSTSVMETNSDDTLENKGNVSKKNNKQQNEFIVEEININADVPKMNMDTSVNENQSPKKNKNKKKKNKSKQNGNIKIESTGNIKQNTITNEVEKDSEVSTNVAVTETQGPIKKKKINRKKKSKLNQSKVQIEPTSNVNPSTVTNMEVDTHNESKSENTSITDNQSPKKKNKRKKKSKQNINNSQIESGSNENVKVNSNSVINMEVDSNNDNKSESTPTTENQSPKKENKKKKKSKQNKNNDKIESESNENIKVNPNAVTNQDTDSEHDSDDEMDSENEEINKKALDTGPAGDSSDEAPDEVTINKKGEKQRGHRFAEEEIKRTLFVGNVPFSAKTKKEMKKIFNKYGQIESVSVHCSRIRTVPVKDARDTPKLAVIKQELHPDRSTVNVYIRFTTANSVQKALAENNTVLNGCHLRVHPSETTGVPHDPKASIFVGNVPFTLEDEELRAKFEKCGEIESVRIVRDKKTCIGKGFGYINFKSKDGVELALALTEEDLTIKNRILRVKRCSQPTDKHLRKREYLNKPRGKDLGKKFGGGTQNDSGQQGNFRRQDQGNGAGNFGRQDQSNGVGNFGRGKFGGKKDGFGRQDQGNRAGNFGRGKFGGKKDGFGRQDQGGGAGNFGRGKFQGQDDDKNNGAFRRVMNKRKNQDSGDGPPSKKQNVDQPKKERKEFVGMTAEKKKKNKFDKGLKKKKALSEILTKNKNNVN